MSTRVPGFIPRHELFSPLRVAAFALSGNISNGLSASANSPASATSQKTARNHGTGSDLLLTEVLSSLRMSGLRDPPRSP